MEEEKLFRIGDVAKMFHISTGTLRHYERMGIVVPEYIEEKSGYRYYSIRKKNWKTDSWKLMTGCFWCWMTKKTIRAK